MKRFGALVTLVALFSCPLMGQQRPPEGPDSSTASPTRAQVMEFMEVMHVRQRLQSSVQTQRDDMTISTHNMFNTALPSATPEQKAKFEMIVADALREMFTDYPFDDVLRDMIPIYQSHFSESDLKQIIVFYSSPIGQKVLKEMPAMSAQAMRVSLTRLQPKIDEIMKSLDVRVQEMVNEDSSSAGKSKGTTKPDPSHP